MAIQEILVVDDSPKLLANLKRVAERTSGGDVVAAKEKDWSTQVILVTAFGRPTETGPMAISKGAYDYVDRNAPGNYLKRLQQIIGPALARQEQKRPE